MDSAAREIEEPLIHTRLSAILPNYNHAEFVGHAIGAIVAQLDPCDELIVIDDASRDASWNVLEELAAGDGRIRLMRNATNQGALVTLQRGLDAARGRYVYFAAADDEIMPDFFHPAMSVLDANPACGLFCADAVLRDGKSRAVIGHRPAVRPLAHGGYLDADQVRALFRTADNFVLTGSAVFRREAVVEKGGFDARNGSFADGILARKIAMARGLHYEPRAVAIWNVFSDGLSRSTAFDLGKAKTALVEIPERIARDPDFPPWYAALFARRWRFGAARLAIMATPPDRDLLSAMAGRTMIDRIALAGLGRCLNLRLGRLLALAWISLRLRPFRLRDVLRTAIARRREGSGTHARNPGRA